MFVLAVPIRAVSTLLPIPDPRQKFPGNRRVDPPHAEGFSRYWQENEQWATPPLVLDTEYPLGHHFEPVFTADQVESGWLALPDSTPDLLAILDGQHRILGWHMAQEDIRLRLAAAERLLRAAADDGDDGRLRSAESQLGRLAMLDGRLDSECVTLEIFEGVDLDQHRQFFSDIATNAKGITKSQVAAFDQRDLVNRVAAEIAENHTLVKGAVDFEKDRTVGASANFLSGKNVVDIVRASSIGFESRATQRLEARLEAAPVANVTMHFLDVLVDEVPGILDLSLGRVTPADLREHSLIASATILRCLAGAFRLVAVSGIDELQPHVDAVGEAGFRSMLRRLAGAWAFPIDGRWLATGFFPHAGSRAPSSRAQDLRGLTLELARWARDGVPSVE